MKLQRTIDSAPSIVITMEEDKDIILTYFSLKNAPRKWASLAMSFVKTPGREVQDRLDAIDKFYTMTKEEAIEWANRSVGIHEDITITQK